MIKITNNVQKSINVFLYVILTSLLLFGNLYNISFHVPFKDDSYYFKVNGVK